MTTLWLCPCLRPHMVEIRHDPQKERLRRYCKTSRTKIDLRFLCRRDISRHIYVTRRRRAVV
jgi:hypothetical protein